MRVAHMRLRHVAFLAALALVAGLVLGIGTLAGAPTKTKALTKVRFQFVWTASANSTPFIVAKAENFYKRAGLDVTLYESQDPTASLPLVGSGSRDLGVSYPPDVLLAAAKGLPVVSMWAQYQVNPLGVVSVTEHKPIRSPSDLVGKTIGVTSLPMDQAQFALMLQKNGIQKSQLSVVDPGFNGGQLVGQGKLDGASGVPWFEVVALQVQGLHPVLMEYRKHGSIDFPFIVMVGNKSWVAKHRAAVRAFVKATIRGYTWAKAHRAKAVADVMKMYPKLDRTVQQRMWNDVIPLSESALTRKHNVGWLNMAQLKALQSFLLTNKILPSRVNASSVFTNAYQPAK